MKRLLRLLTIVMVTMTLLMPILECFDRWDSPGLRNDSEFPIFLITLFLSLVMLVAVAIARRTMARQNAQTETDIVYRFVRSVFRSLTEIPVSPFTSASPPLRI